MVSKLSDCTDVSGEIRMDDCGLAKKRGRTALERGRYSYRDFELHVLFRYPFVTTCHDLWFPQWHAAKSSGKNKLPER